MDLMTRLQDFIVTNLTSKPSLSSESTYFSSWTTRWYPATALNAAGLVALADLTTVARRTALTGSSSLWDTLILCPGLHKQQQQATELNGGEYPLCAAMTTGYVFRVENQATVAFMQRVGRPGHLTCLSVSEIGPTHNHGVPAMAYYGAATITIMVLRLLTLLRDRSAVVALIVLMFVRFINFVVLRRRSAVNWKGEPEPDKQSDLIVLLSQDRWVRVRGAVNDVKAVTSGEWMRKTSPVESTFVAFSTLLAYLNVGLVATASEDGKILLLVLFFCTAGLLGLANECTDELTMYGRRIKVDGPRIEYRRRLELAKQLVDETRRHDWALRLGMLQPHDLNVSEEAATRHSDNQAAGERLSTTERESQVEL